MWKFFAAKFIRYRHQDRCKGVHSRTNSRDQPLRRGRRPDRGNKIRIIDKISEKLCFVRAWLSNLLTIRLFSFNDKSRSNWASFVL